MSDFGDVDFRTSPSSQPTAMGSADSEPRPMPRILRGPVPVPPQAVALADAVREYLRVKTPNAGSELVRFLHETFSTGGQHDIDYNRYGLAFAQTYLLENYWKTVGALLRAGFPIGAHVADLGAGSGACSLAYLALLDSAVPVPRWPVLLTLVDKSDLQLALARALLAHIIPRLQHLEVRVDCRQRHLADWQPDCPIDFMMYGHVLTENQPRVHELLARGFEATSAHGAMCVIERADDPVWSSIEASCNTLCLPTETYAVHVSRESLYPGTRDLMPHKPFVSTRALVIPVPRHKLLVHLLRSYFAAWLAQSPEALVGVFTADAEYSETPFESPMRGLPAIQDYWRTHVLRQRDTSICIRRVAYHGTDAWCEWEARFNRDHESVEIAGVLTVTADLAKQRLSSLREYFRTRKSTSL